MAVVIVDLQLYMQSVPILHLVRCTRYNIILTSLSVTCDRSVVSSTNKTDGYDIAEALLRVALSTITLDLLFTILFVPDRYIYKYHNPRPIIYYIVCTRYIYIYVSMTF